MSSMLSFFRGVHYAYMRRLDILILWPACKREAETRGRDLDTARAAFRMHCFRDRPWLWLGAAEISRRVDTLT